MKLEGSLATFPLRELIEMTVYSSVTGVINIFGRNGCGQIFFRDGQPYHACYGSEVGVGAVVYLFEEQVAAFAFVADTVSDGETLWYDPMELIELGERQASRWALLRPQIASVDLVPHPVSTPDTARFHLNPEHWPFFTYMDGLRSIAAIAEASSSELLDVCEAVAQMKQDGLITFQAPVSPPAPLAPTPQPETQSRSRPGILDRLLASMPPEVLAAAQQAAVAKTASPLVTPKPSSAPPPNQATDDPIMRLLRG